eukprot:CAMPEP_0115460604 /NCGR_PEP_ID=MMETSP0271-20121206/46871_1 /TAXON_ID=71861 /ORGANISM="Scrippsiella trochoidea, Strain CCMP3099" /LENGTH=202 /DNA_ID=CAMNT_0002887319 /DNA_START=27 /DNA_END=632 /DNA_ORIENTATION=+
MGAATSAAAMTCTQPPTSQEEYRLPWALAQAERFESEDCPFCALRRSHCAWLRTEIKRLTSEVASLQTTIPPKFFPDLERRLEEVPLPDSAYTGGVDDVRGSACEKCSEQRREVRQLQREARTLDAQCKARIDFHRRFARRIEALLIEKRRIEAQLFFSRRQGGDDKEVDGHFCAITRVNEPDEDAHALVTSAQTAPPLGQP